IRGMADRRRRLDRGVSRTLRQRGISAPDRTRRLNLQRSTNPMLPKKSSKSAAPETIDEYLAPLSNEKRAALEKLRKDIKSAAPKAEECISYQVPSFRLFGRL